MAVSTITQDAFFGVPAHDVFEIFVDARTHSAMSGGEGAEIDARDSLGDTPLRRSVNCDKIQVASLLIARGADVRSIGNKGLTPLQAARTSEMKQLLDSAGGDFKS